MLLEVLIPTYGRKANLSRNLAALTKMIEELALESKVALRVSDNASPDGSADVVRHFMAAHPSIAISLHEQTENVGLEANVVDILSRATGEFVMTLGDDDYIDAGYLKKCVELLESGAGYTCIIPSFYNVTPEGEEITPRSGRDHRRAEQSYEGGSATAARLMCKGHQLSGLVFVRDDTVERYLAGGQRNIYPFMFFVGFNARRGRVRHQTRPTVHVTRVSQDQKDWNYGVDGLFSQRIKNARGLFSRDPVHRLMAEYYIAKNITFTFPLYRGDAEKRAAFVQAVRGCPDATIAIKAYCILAFRFHILVNALGLRD